MAKSSRNKTTAVDAYDWRAEDDLRILVDAEKIKKDPERLNKAKACAKKKVKEMAIATEVTATLAESK